MTTINVNVHFGTGDKVEAVAKTVHVSAEPARDAYLLSLYIGGAEVNLFAHDFSAYSDLITKIETACRAHSMEMDGCDG